MNKQQKAILATITQEQWEAIEAMASQMANQATDEPKVESEQPQEAENIPFNLKVTKIVKAIGVPANIMGYKYLQKAIVLLNDDESYIGAITKRLYPDIAKAFATTSNRVERALRHAIEVAWETADPEKQEVQRTIFGSWQKPINSNAIATLTEYVKLYM